MSWIANTDSQARILQSLPGIGDHFLALYRTLWTLPQVPPDTLELCRLRLAQLHGSRSDWELEQHPVDPVKKACLGNWSTHADFNEVERACLAFAEVHAMDAHAITDEQAGAVIGHLGEEGLVALVQALGVFDAMIRLGLVWGVPAQDLREEGS